MEGEQLEKLKHSEFGIASLIVGGLGILGFVILVILVAYFCSQGRTSSTDPAMVAIGFGLFLDVFVLFLGVILGLAGVFIPGRNKMTAIIGMLFNAVLFLLFMLLLIYCYMQGK